MTNAQEIKKVVDAAWHKFGDCFFVQLDSEARHANFYKVACKRRDPVWEEAPYMTITASVPSGENARARDVSFFWGHYDLTWEKVSQEISKLRKEAA